MDKARAEKLKGEVERAAIAAQKAKDCAADRLSQIRKAAEVLVASKTQADDESVAEGVCAAADAAYGDEDASGALAASADIIIATCSRLAVVAPRPPAADRVRLFQRRREKRDTQRG